MLLKHAAVLSTVGACLILSAGACGSRSTLLPGEARPEEESDASVVECTSSEDCGDVGNLCGPILCLESKCVQRFTVCSDDDPCTVDTCDPATGGCVSTPATLDVDGDGFKGPRPGTAPGAPDSCGDDCDDTRASAYPGATETCDSVDNDCNGVVDDGYGYAPPTGGQTDVRVSTGGLDESGPGGLAQDGTRYFAVYSGEIRKKTRTYASFLDDSGNRIGDESRLVQVESDTYASGVVWTGDRYGVAWSDRRSANYEIFFAMFDREGKKMAPGDIPLSATDVFSINVDLVWTGTEFVAVWQDGSGGNQSFSIVGRRVGLDGVAIGEPTTVASNGESPRLSVGRPGIGMVFTNSDPDEEKTMFFQPLNFDLAALGPAKEIETPVAGQYPVARWNESEYVVSWSPARQPFELYGTRLDGLGNALAPARALTDSPGNARFGSIIPLGDRLLHIYSDDRDGGDYEIYSQTLDNDLTRRGLPTRITNDDGNSVGAIPILGPKGDIGVLFQDRRGNNAQTYFTHLVCETAPSN